MAKLERKEVKLFAENCKPTLTTEFRSESADGTTASFSRDPDLIQNENYGQGWVKDENNLNQKIYGEDLNSLGYVLSYFLKYLYENGIPEWLSITNYFEHSIVRVDNKLFISLQDDNQGNDPLNTNGYWSEIPLETITAAIAGSGSSIIKEITGNSITFKSLSVDGYGSLQDNGDQLNIHILGGSGIVDAFWGQIQGTLTNQTDLVSALNDKQDNLTFDSPLSKDVNNEVSIPKATSSINGYLDATDFQTFAGKQDALDGFTHSYDTDTDTAEIYPTATNSNIGTSQYPITNINASNVNASTITSGGLFNLDGEINIRCQDGQNIEIGTDGSGLAYKTIDVRSNSVEVNGHLSVSNTISMRKGQIFSWQDGGTDVAQFYTGGSGELTLNSNANQLTTNCSILPDTDNTYDIGSGSKRVANLYSNNSTADWNKSVYNSSTLTSSMKFGTALYQNYQTDDGELAQILDITANYPNINDHSTTTKILPYKPSSNIYGSRNNICSLGDSGRSFAYGWIVKFNTDEIKGINSDNVIRVGLGEFNQITGNSFVVKAYSDAHNLTLGSSSNTAQIQVLNSAGNGVWTGTSFVGTSDEKLKKNIEANEEKAIDKIKELRVVDFNWKREDDKANKHTGFIANEVEKVIPSAVSRAIIPDEKKSEQEETLFLDKTEFIPYLVKAVQELSEKVETLEARVKELEANKEELKK